MFDPYYKWLGIPAKEQPLNHYRLLGLQAFENDLDVIEGAADRQMAFVRQYQSGEHAGDAAKLLNELATARICLLKPETKSAYDSKLREQLTPSEPKISQPPFSELTFPGSEMSPKAAPKIKRKKSAKPKASQTSLPLIGGGVVIVILLMAFLFSSRPRPIVDKTSDVAIGESTAASAISDVTSAASSTAAPPGSNADGSRIESPSNLTTQSSGKSISRTAGPWINLFEWSEGLDWSPKGINWNDQIEQAPTRSGIRLKNLKPARFPLPAIIEGSYELEVEFTRNQGSGAVAVIFPAGPHNVRLLLSDSNGSISMLESVDGKPIGIQRPGTFSNNERHRVLIRVHQDGEKAGIRVDWDKTMDYFQWEGPLSDLQFLDSTVWQISLIRRPWIGSYDSDVIFHHAKVRMLSGTIRPDFITPEDRAEDLKNGFVRLVAEKPESASVGWAQFLVNQLPLEFGSRPLERRWPLLSRELKICEDFYSAHAPSQIACAIPAGAKSFSAVGYNDAGRTSRYIIVIDGKRVYESGITDIVIAKVDIPAQSSQLELVVEKVGIDNPESTYWCYPRFHSVPATLVTEAMLHGDPGPLLFSVVSGTAGYGAVAHNESIPWVQSLPLRFGDATPCDEFLFAHASSLVTYHVSDGMTRFTAIGYNVISHSTNFEIWADSNRIYESPRAGITAINVKLPAGTKSIGLKINDLDGIGHDLSMWCFPRLHHE